MEERMKITLSLFLSRDKERLYFLKGKKNKKEYFELMKVKWKKIPRSHFVIAK